MKNRSRIYDINRPRPRHQVKHPYRHGDKYTKYKISV